MRLFLTLIAAALLTGGICPPVFAGEEQKPAAAAQPADPKAAEMEGCMPGGGCCGACQAAKAEEAKKDGAVAEGCACKRNKQKTN